MPKLTVDGKQVEVPEGTRVIEAAKKAHIDVPYYCYHPGLSIAGNCRMCLVEIEKMPKLQIACHMTAQDGMVVKTNTEKVLQTRKHILEFLLINHPVDCPVCDQSGECWLQDYYMKHGLYDSRLNEDKLRKPKAVPVGPTVMLDAERCILCSRCERFTDEISKTNEFGFIQRGNHSEITVFPGKELKNPYSGCTVDICPVGALTDRDFRFKMRVWYLQSRDTLCNGCSRGCNIQMHYCLDRPHHAHGARVQRLKPRFHESINKWWMCDEGRYGYKFHDFDRITEPVKRVEKPTQPGWEAILAEVAKQVEAAQGNFGVLLSPQLSNEELFMARHLFAEKLGAKHMHLVSPKPEGFEDDILIRADKNPNSKGAEFLGFRYDEKSLEAFLKACEKGKVKGLIAFGQNLPALPAHVWTVFIGSNHNVMSEYVAYVLPAATYAEKEGTFTNFEGRVQKFNKVLEPMGEARPEWQILIELAKEMGIHIHYDAAEEIFNEMALQVGAFKGMRYEKLGDGGSDIRTMAAPTIPALEQFDNIL